MNTTAVIEKINTGALDARFVALSSMTAHLYIRSIS